MNALFGAVDLSEILFTAIRLAAAVGGAIVGWFLAGPVTRLLYRLAFQRPVPGGLLPWAKMSGALLVGFLFFCIVHLGGTGLGWGWGPGEGSGPGFGPGTGGGPGTGLTKDGKGHVEVGKDKKNPQKSTRDEVEIELISSQKYKQDGKYYLLKRAEPALDLKEVESFFEKSNKNMIVKIVLTDESVGTGTGAAIRLREVANKYDIPTVGATD
jgi:hypothetical protein